MKNQTYRKGWAFILTLAMVFTTVFGGFGFLGIKGAVREVYAATTTRTSTLDLRSLPTQNNSDEGWAWNADTKVLTLSGINLSTASKTGLNVPANTTVVLVGDNRIESTSVGSDGSDGIYSYDGGLSIIGGNSDSLTVAGGASTNSNNSYGINIRSGNLTIDGNVTATGGTGNSSMGIAIYDGTLFINEGTVNAIGGQGSSNHGIRVFGNIVINGGNVTAETSYSGTWDDIGIRADNMTISSTADVKASGKVYGAYVDNTLTMSGIGTKLGAKAQSTNYANSYGLIAKNIAISNASLTATGGAVNNASGLSCGISVTTNLTINSGTISSAGGTVDTGTSSGIKASDTGTIDFKGGTISASAGSASNRYAVLTDNANKISFGEGPATMVTSPVGGGLSSDGRFIATVSGGAVAATNVAISPGTYTMSASWLPEFASQPVGYVTAPAEQTVTITNTGNQQIILTQPTASKYVIGTLSTTILAVSGTATFTVQPKTGLSVGTQNELIRITGSGSAATDVYAQYTVNPGVTTTASINGHAQIYANGNALILAPGTTAGNTVVYLDADHDGVIDPGTDRMAQLYEYAPTTAGYDLKLGWIYGGAYCTDYTGDTQITMLGGYVTTILGGGTREGYYGGDITGNSKITINGGTVGYIYGTGRVGLVSGTKTVQINGGSIRGNISDYTAGKLTKADGTTSVYKTTLTLPGISVETAVDSSLTLDGVASGYGLNDVKTTSSGALTFYLPIGTATASYDGHNYVAIVDASGNSTFISITKETTPTASFEASTKTLSNVSSGMKYSTDGGVSWADITGASTAVSGVTVANGIQVYKPGNGSTTTDSDTQIISVTKAITPTSGDFTVTQPGSIGGTGTIAGITASMEYSTNSESSWAAGGSTISNIAGGTTCLVRVKASGTALASNNYSITINAFSGSKETTPTASFEASTMTLSNVSSGMKYSTNGGVSWADITGASTAVSGVTAADGVQVYKPGNGSTTTDSDTQTITVTKAATPSSGDFTVTQPASIGGTGTIAGVTASMEYSTNSGSSWVAGGSTLSSIAGGTTYLVRVKASGTALASNNYSITINTFSGTDIYSISADTALINFGSQTAGYAAPASRTVTITNTGNQTITLTDIATTNASSNYTIGALSDTVLDPNDAATFTLQPKTGLVAGTYNETISVSGTSGAAASITVQFSVTAADNGGSHGGGGTVTTPTDTSDTPIRFNGQSENAGKTVVSKDGDQTVTTVTLDDAKIQEKIKTEDKGTVVSIPISGSSDIGQGVLNGQTIKDMEKKESVLEIKTGSATYSLPASEINIDSVSSKFGQSVKLEDIKISVKIEAPTADTAKVVEDTANKNNYQVVVKPVEFEITCTSGSKTVAVSKFNGYVERVVAIPDGVDPGKVTTGVVLNKDGTFSHVPTAIVKIDGKYYAKINSLTNSTYSVIYNPIAFADVTGHWAKDSINNMGSRLVISGVGKDKFEPNRDITRAEFAAIMVRALGLAPDTAKNTFSDVSASSWYSGYVGTAASYGIISGYDADTFAPNAKITREQAMAMVARAMTITDLDSTTASIDASSPLAGYTDTSKISGYAKAGIIACLNTGVVTGKTADTIAPKANITRAEVAVIIERLLKKSELI